MSLDYITLAVESDEKTDIKRTVSCGGKSVTQKISARELLKLDYFADELQKYTQAKIIILENDLSSAPSTGIIILCQISGDLPGNLATYYPDLPSSMTQRIMLMSGFGRNEKTINWVNTYGFVGSIDDTTYSRWVNDLPNLPMIYGLTTVAEKIGALRSHRFGNYCHFGPPSSDFLSTLIEYLEAYHELILSPSSKFTVPKVDPRWPTIWEIVYERKDSRDLRGVDLSGCDLDGGYFESANLQDANLSYSNLVRAHFEQANLQNINLSHSNLEDALLQGADLCGANLIEANLSGVFLQKADLRKANLAGAWLGEAILRDTNIDDTTNLDERWRLVWRIVNQIQKDKNLYGVNLSYGILADTDLRYYNLCGAVLDEANLARASLFGSDLRRALLTKTYLAQANLSTVDLSQAKLRFTNLDMADLTDANLTDAILSDVYLTGANLTGANLTGAYLGYASLHGANLTETKLSGITLNKVKYDLQTKWPVGFNPEKAGAILEVDE
ncbi:MAG: pentapeptide repeat-containing protein [Anaerolineales bacterium]|nr:pentapeptide repeat-containing protein [Anaerolineales bacterium]